MKMNSYIKERSPMSPHRTRVATFLLVAAASMPCLQSALASDDNAESAAAMGKSFTRVRACIDRDCKLPFTPEQIKKSFDEGVMPTSHDLVGRWIAIGSDVIDHENGLESLSFGERGLRELDYKDGKMSATLEFSALTGHSEESNPHLSADFLGHAIVLEDKMPVSFEERGAVFHYSFNYQANNSANDTNCRQVATDSSRLICRKVESDSFPGTTMGVPVVNSTTYFIYIRHTGCDGQSGGSHV